MAAKGKDFVERDDVRQALEELLEQCSTLRERGESPSPDVAAFLRERGIEPHPDSPLQLHHSVDPAGEGSVGAQGVAPTVNVCDDGTWCVRRCVVRDGKRHCEWVCA